MHNISHNNLQQIPPLHPMEDHYNKNSSKHVSSVITAFICIGILLEILCRLIWECTSRSPIHKHITKFQSFFNSVNQQSWLAKFTLAILTSWLLADGR